MDNSQINGLVSVEDVIFAAFAENGKAVSLSREETESILERMAENMKKQPRRKHVKIEPVFLD